MRGIKGMLWETSLLDADEVRMQWIQMGKNEIRPIAQVVKKWSW
jgi:hypothetical protein